MKNKSFVILGVVLLLVVAGWLTYYKSRPLYIGFGAGLSGQWSQLGVQTRNGFLQAVEDVNSNGGINGRKVVPVIMDDKNDNDSIDTMILEMKEKKIDYLVGFSVSSMTPSVHQIIEDSNIL